MDVVFLSHFGVRDVRVTQQVTQRYYSPLTGGTTEGKLRSKSAHGNSATARRTAHEVRWSRDTEKLSILRGSQNIRIHPCACLKHSNFLNHRGQNEKTGIV